MDTSEQSMLRDAVAKIASGFGHTYYVEKTRAGAKTDELWTALGDAGFLGVNIPEAYGGGGMGLSELTIVTEEVAAQGCPLLLILVSPAICGSVIARFGTEAQKQRWLPGIASGATKMAFAITEPDAGSNSHKLSTTAVREGDVWRLRGTKYFISGVDESEAILVVARTGRNDQTGKGLLSLFIVDADDPKMRRDPLPVEMVSPEKQFTLFLDDVVLEPDRLVGDEGDGLRQVFYGLNPERITGAAIANGLARYAMDKAAAYAKDRSVWGTPIARHQAIAHPLARAKIDVELARLMTWKAAYLYDRDEDAGEAANMAKYAAGLAANAALDRAIQTHGGNGMTTEFGLADLWGMVRLLRIAPVSEEMILNHVAQHSLGLPKSY